MEMRPVFIVREPLSLTSRLPVSDCTIETGPASPEYTVEHCELPAGAISNMETAAVSHRAKFVKNRDGWLVP